VGIRIASRLPNCKARKSSKLGLTAAQIKGLEEDSNGHSYSPATNLRSDHFFLENIRWQTYLMLLEDLDDRHIRLTYDTGDWK